MINADATEEYTANLAHFIRDVRKDLKVPKLPFVIGQMGVDGPNANGHVQQFKAAEAAVVKLPSSRGTWPLVKTDVFWDTDADGRLQERLAEEPRGVEQGRQRLCIPLPRQRQDNVRNRPSRRRSDA